MAETELVKIEIHYDAYEDDLTVKSPPKHRSESDFDFNPGGVEFPYVVEIPTEEAERISRAFEEYRWAQNRLSQLTRGPRPQKCMCGNCPDKEGEGQ